MVALLFVCWFGAGYLRGIFLKKRSTDPQPNIPPVTIGPPPCEHRRLLDGVCVATEEAVDPRLVAVMIENNADAWPLSGVAKAAVVYEAPVEANIPRFMALYPEGAEVEKVGPVRSARPYYVDWVQEYSLPLYMHVGGSEDALKQIERDNIVDFDEFYRGWYFWRSESRSAPHNTYTSSRLWKKAIQDYPAKRERAVNVWQFDEGIPCITSCITEVYIPFNTGLYEAGWKFVSSTNSYTRYQRTTPVQDEDGSSIYAHTIIVQKVRVLTVDAIGRKSIGTVGTGEALIFRNGKVMEARWKKIDRASRTEWLDDAGNPIPLQPGNIWIEVVDISTRIRTVSL